MTIRVLLVDDHAIVRDGLAAILEDEGDIVVVGQAQDGDEALRKVAAESPDVVVMDIVMPEMNGLEATQAMLEIHPGLHVIILSMHTSPEHIYLALQAGAVGYLVKAAAGSEVVEAVRTVCAGARYLSPQVADSINDVYLKRRSGKHEAGPIASLSPRERRVLQLVAEGNSSTEIAEKLHLSSKTVDTYRHRIMVKLNIRNLAELIRFAIQHGMTPP